MSPTTLETRAVTYELEVEIAASPSTVWRSLTEETDAWWLPDFRMVGPGSKVHFDARAGGQLVERSEDGGSLLWYTVLMSVPEESLDLVGHVTAAYGGPATTMLRLGLEATETGTLLRISDALVGHVEESSVNSLESGWLQLFREGLKAHAEG
jgi:uncharacterized protein YndB with AHSA1/START domain